MKALHLLPQLILTLLLTASLLRAQVTQTWGNGTGTWDTTTANWSGAVWTNGNNATIGTTAARTGTVTIVPGGVSVSNVTSGSGGGAAYTHTLQGGAIALSGTNSVWTIGGPAGSQLLVSSAITGAGTLDKQGTRLLILAGNNTYTGGTTITAGALQIGNGGTTGSVAGNITANSSLTFNRSDTYTYGGIISGTSAITHAGSGTLVLTGDSTDTNSLTVNSGGLQLGNGGATGSWAGGIVNNGSVVFNRNATLNYGRAISGTGSVTINGTGAINLNAASTYTGSTTVSSGATLGGSGSLTSAVTVANGATLAGVSGQTLTMAGLTLNATSNVNVALGAASTTGLFAINGNLTLDGTLNISDAGGFGPGLYRLVDYTGALTDNGLALGLTGGASASSLAIQTATANQVNLFFDAGPANLWRGGAGTWSADPGITGWTDVLGVVNNAWQPNFAIFNTGAGIVTIDPAAGAVEATGVQFAADGFTIAGGTLTNNTASAVYRVGNGTGAGAAMTATISAPIAGTGGINKTDLGTLVLSGANTYGGATTVTNGTLRVDGNQSGATGAVAVASGGTLTGSGTLGGAVTVANGGTLAGQSGQTLTMAGLALNNTSNLNVALGVPSSTRLFQVNGNLTLDGSLRVTDAGGFGPGVYRLIDYTGSLTNNGLAIGLAPVGNQFLAVQTSIGNQINLVFDSGPRNFWRGGAGTWTADVGSAAWSEFTYNASTFWTPQFAIFQATPAGTVTIDTAAGAVEATGMQFAIDGYTLTGGALTNNTANAVFRVGDGTSAGAAMSGTISAPITGTGGLDKTDLGTLVLSGANTYGGATTVTAGTLRVNGNQAGATGTVTVASGATLTGSGTLGGAVAIANGGILAGTAGQTLTMPDLTLNGSSIVNVSLGAPSTTGLFQVNGNLTLDGTLNLADAGGFGPGLYRLFNYTGSLTDNGLAFGTTAGAPLSNVSVQTSVANQVNMIFDLGPQNFWRGGNGTWSASAASSAWTDFLGSTSVGWTPQFALFQAAPGTVTVDTAAGAVVFTGAQFAANGYTVAGGTLTNNTANAIVRVGDGTGAGATMTATISAPIAGTGGINKTDLGTLTLSGANTYAGATTVSTGTLRVNGNQSGATGAVTVAGGATLTGSGTLGGAVTVANGGILAGQSGQTLAMAGLTLNSASSVNVSLGAPSPAALFQINGNLTLDGTLNLTDAGGFGAGLYRLFNYTGSLTDNGLAFGTVAGAIPGNLSLQTSVAKQVNLILIDTTTPLPLWQGGSGTWNGNVTGGGFSNANGSITGGWRPGFAIFGGTPGTVTIDTSAGQVIVTGVQFATNGYVVTGSELTTHTASAPIRVGDGSAAGSGYTATISASINGTGGIDKTDLGRLVLTGTNTYQSATTVSGGVLEVSRDANLGAASAGLTMKGGTLRNSATFTSSRPVTLASNGGTFDTAADLTLQGAISGPGGFTKTGPGRLTLGGTNTFTGATTIAAGSVFLNNSSLAATTIANGASLTGNGTIRGNLSNQGLLSPGASPGTITVNGNFTQSSSGSYAVELASPTSFDKLVVTGTASLAGSLVVNGLNGYVPQPGQSFSILTATGGVSGAFATVTTPWDQASAMLRFKPTYGTNDVTLAMLQRPFAELNGTSNQVALGQSIDGAIAAATIPGMRASLNASPTDAVVLGALDQLSPQRYERWFEQAIFSTGSTVRSAGHRLTEMNDQSKAGLWFELTRRETHFDATTESARAEGEGNGILTGIDAVVTPSTQIGLLFGYVDEKLDLDENGSRTSTERFNVAAYGRHDAGLLLWEAVAGFGKSNLDSTRTIAIPGYQKVATSQTNGFEGFVDLRAALPIERAGFTLAPYAAVQYVHWQGNSFTETGADEANLTMDAMTGQSLSGRAGLAISRAYQNGKGSLVPRFDLAWRHEFQDETRELAGRLGGTAFTLQSRTPDTDALTASLSLDANLSNRLSAFGRLDGIWADTTRAFEAQAGLSYRF